MRHANLRRIAFIAAVILGLGISGCTSRGQWGDPNKIQVTFGAVLPLTGAISDYGRETSSGIDLAIEQANMRSSRYQYRVLYEDSKGTSAEAIGSLRKLIQVNGVAAVVGENISGPTVAMVPVADAAKVTIISPSAASPILSGMSKYFFRIYPSDAAEGAYLGNAVYSTFGVRTAAVLFLNNESCAALKDAFVETFTAGGGSIVQTLSYNDSETDFRPFLTNINRSNPEAIYLAGYYQDGGAILRQARELGIRARFFGSTTHENPQLLNIAGEAAEGFIYPFSVGYDENLPESIAFRRDYIEKNGQDPGAAAVLGYDCIQLLVKAVEAGGPDRAAIRDQLAKIEGFKGATGEITFQPTGDVEKPVSLRIVKGGEFVIWEN